MKPSDGRTPRVSVIVPTFNRTAELRLCLSGFARQSAAPGEFEVIVIDDGSTEDVERVASEFRDRFPLHLERCGHGGPSVARNLGIERSRAPLLVLYDDDLRPAAGLIETCQSYHETHQSGRQLELLYFVPDPAIADMAVTRWAFHRIYPFPPAPGVHGWDHFWGGSLSCKRALFAEQRFDPACQAVEDAEFGFRAGGFEGLEIYFQPRVTGYFVRRLGVLEICRRQYRMAYYRRLMAVRHGIEFPHPIYRRPEDFLIEDWPTFRAMLAAARPQESAVFPPGSARFELLCRMWGKADFHAIASGWMAARAGLSPGEL